jgi:two-component system sensor kinase FixL
MLSGPSHEVQGYLWLTRDITERRRLELERERLSRELAHVGRVFTMGALTSSLAHELNQPLSAILSNAQAATRFLNAAVPNLAEVRGALDDIARDTHRAGEVIRQMRALVRKEAPRYQPLDCNLLVGEVVTLLHSDAVIRKIRIMVELDSNLRAVSANNVEVQQVLLNLVLNAFDAMRDVPEENRTVTIRTWQLESAFTRVEVSDEGTGLSPEKLLKLFEPFRSSKRDGLGLGLAISRSIIEAHRGRLWAENNPDAGATFYFTLPVHESVPAANAPDKNGHLPA